MNASSHCPNRHQHTPAVVGSKCFYKVCICRGSVKITVVFKNSMSVPNITGWRSKTFCGTSYCYCIL